MDATILDAGRPATCYPVTCTRPLADCPVANRPLREVVASFELDDAVLECTMRLPASYPLRCAEAECTKRVGVSEARLRKWLLSMAALLRASNGALGAALALWNDNVCREFEGLEACPICYMVIHAASSALPRLPCRQCRNRFHSACLYNWFTSSNKSSCPVRPSSGALSLKTKACCQARSRSGFRHAVSSSAELYIFCMCGQVCQTAWGMTAV